MKGSTLFAQGLRKSYNGRRVVDDVTVSVRTGEIVGLFGPNGAGKTTTFYMMIGFVTPDEGKIFLDSDDITFLPMFLRARMGITYLPQEPSVFKKMSVEDNLYAVLEFYEARKDQMRRRVEEILEAFGLTHLSKRMADSLSGGERRRLEISRAFLLSPRFMLLDEPFSGIDPISVSELKTIIKGLQKKGIGILLSDHNVRESLPLCEKAYVMSQGRILLEGPPAVVAKDRVVKDVYLGEEFSIET
jgi:lipopolysaccharide export system ATP-binding protein